MQEEIINLIKEITEIPTSKIKEDTNLVEDLELDSLDLTEIFAEIEDKYNIEILDDDIYNLQTVNDIIEYIEDKNV